jgi:pectate lyase
MFHPLIVTLTRSACACLAGALWGCATVTQEAPPSRLDASAAEQAAAGSGGRGNRAPVADMTALPSQPSSQPGQTSNESERPPPPSGLSSGGSGGAPVTVVADAGPTFAAGMVLLEENFENFAATSVEWTSVEGSAWEVQTNAELVSNVYTQTETTRSQPNLSVAGSVAWRDVIVEADLRIEAFNGSSSSYMAGLCVRVRDAESFYLIGIRSNDGKLGLRRYADGGTNLIQSEFEEGTTGVWYHLRVEAVGSTLTAYLDEQLMFTQTDDDIASGGIGLCTVRATASFDNVRVTAP